MKILLAVDTSEASRKSVEFVAKACAGASHAVTLLHVVDSLPDYIVSRSSDPSAGAAYRQVASEWTESSQAEGEKILQSAAARLTAAGLPASSVTKKLVTRDALPEARKVVAALAIIDEMKTGHYEVVCVGRRGTSAASGAFPGSVAEKILREAQGTTVWVVD